MSEFPAVLRETIKILIGDVLLLVGLGIFAYKLKLSGFESYTLNALLVLVPLARATYRAARAELRLQKASAREDTPSQALPSRPLQTPPVRASSIPYQPATQEKPARHRPKRRLPILPILKYLGWAFLLFYLALIVYFSGW